MTRPARSARWVAALLLLSVALPAAWLLVRFVRERSTAPVASTAPLPSAPADTVVDPLAPERIIRLDSAARGAGSADWVRARPGFQYSRSSAERGGVNPCAIPAGDVSAFSDWSKLSRGRFTAPRTGAFDATGGFDLVLNFHGDDLARRELLQSGEKFVLYSLTLDPNKSYAPLFSGTKLLSQLVQEIEQALSASAGVPAHARRIGLSAWSAGYVAILAILVQPEARAKDIDGVVLIDGLHGQRGNLSAQLGPFVDYARRAAAGERFLFVAHSSIDPPGFASTSEAAHFLLASLDARPQAVRRDDGLGLELVEFFSRGDFHVRGYAGNDKADHCAQVTLLRRAYTALGRRFRALGSSN
jgi:hypothetical protein